MKNEYTVTRRIYRSWGTENMMKPPKIYFSVMWCVLAAVIAVLMLIMDFRTRFTVFSVLIIIYCFYSAFLHNVILTVRQYSMMAEHYGKTNWTRSVIFEENRFTVSEEKLTMKYDYSEVVHIFEKNNEVRIEAANGMVTRIYKDAFTNGSWEECKNMLKNKCTAAHYEN